MDNYKILKQLEIREKRANPYKFYDNDELIDTILEKEDEIENLQNKLQQKENIIKEVREYVENNKIYTNEKQETYTLKNTWYGLELLGILDKGE